MSPVPTATNRTARKLRRTGNALCLQCHQAPHYQTAQHFFHKPDSPGAQCVNCHMPERTYMGVDARRDHSLRVPDPLASVRHRRAQCLHAMPPATGTDQWAADFIAKRTGRTAALLRAHGLADAAAHGNDATAAAGPARLCRGRRPSRHPARHRLAGERALCLRRQQLRPSTSR